MVLGKVPETEKYVDNYVWNCRKDKANNNSSLCGNRRAKLTYLSPIGIKDGGDFTFNFKLKVFFLYVLRFVKPAEIARIEYE